MDTLYIDCSLAGMSGDMLLSALLSLQDDTQKTINELNNIFEKVFMKNPLISVETQGNNFFRGYKLIIQNELSLSLDELIEIIARLENEFEEKYFNIAKTAFEILLNAERVVHGTEDIHLHELGSSDTIIDIFGVGYLLQQHQIQYIDYSPLLVGSGTVKTSHGILPVPPPVSLEIMQKYRIVEKKSDVIGEAATPTGIAILASLISNLQPVKEIRWEIHGIGYGNKIWPDRENLLRIRAGSIQNTDRISVLETNLDDISGEHLGNLITKVLGVGALDVNYYPIFMKKNRPGYCLRVLCKEIDVKQLSEEVMRLTGTLGIRVNSIERHIGQREFITKKISLELEDEIIEISVPLKVGKYRKKIEFDYLVELADKFKLSPLELEAKIWKALNLTER